MSGIATGVITKLCVDRRYGFIRRDSDGFSLFFHKKSLIHASTFEALHEGQRVEFQSLTTDRGLRAECVTLLADD